MNLTSWGMYPIIKNKSLVFSDEQQLKNHVNFRKMFLIVCFFDF